MRWLVMSLLTVSLALPVLAEGNVYAGKMRFGICSQCHGPDGRGLETMSTPRLAGQRPYYLKRQLQSFQRGIRGTHPNDEKGKMMRPMAMTLPDEQAIDDVIAYIGTLEE